ncbi:MAG: hypothetical protein ABW215_07240 [Kibdelosporangium sp.]
MTEPLEDLQPTFALDPALIEWLNNFPGRPRKVARLLVFVGIA